MTLEDCMTLYNATGEMEGISKSLEWGDDVDLKKVRAALSNLSTKIHNIAEKEINSLTDVDYKRKMLTAQSTQKVQKKDKKQENPTSIDSAVKRSAGPGGKSA